MGDDISSLSVSIGLQAGPALHHEVRLPTQRGPIMHHVDHHFKAERAPLAGRLHGHPQVVDLAQRLKIVLSGTAAANAVLKPDGKTQRFDALCFLVAVCLVLAVPTFASAQIEQRIGGERQKQGKPVVVIDAGHGGIDPGVYAFGILEKDLALEYALQIAAAIKKTGAFEVKLTRTSDDFVSLDKRIAIAKEHQALLFISLHADSRPEESTENGVTIHVKKSSLGSDQGSQSLSSVFARLLGGYLGSQSMSKTAFRESEFKVLEKVSPETMTVLLELGSMSNKENAEGLQSAAYRDAVVAAISRAAEGIAMLRAARN